MIDVKKNKDSTDFDDHETSQEHRNSEKKQPGETKRRCHLFDGGADLRKQRKKTSIVSYTGKKSGNGETKIKPNKKCWMFRDNCKTWITQPKTSKKDTNTPKNKS